MMDYKPFWPETVLFWGAGASEALGFPSSGKQAAVIQNLAEGQKPLEDRIKNAFRGIKIHPDLRDQFKELLLLLFDGNDSRTDPEALGLHKKHVHRLAEHFAREFSLDSEKRIVLEHELFMLHTKYDWIGLRGIIPYLAKDYDPKKHGEGCFSITDLVTTVDLLYQSELSMPTEEVFGDGDRLYLMDKARLVGIKRCLDYLTVAIPRIVAQKNPGKMDKAKIKPFREMFETLAEMMAQEANTYRGRFSPDDRRFYLFSYAAVSHNYDPMMAWLIFHAHKKINDQEMPMDGVPLRLFNDFGDGMGVRRILDCADTDDANLLAFMMNEPVCQRVNDHKYKLNRCIRIGKLLFPHGGFGWRACPTCGRLFTDFGERFDDLLSTVAFGADLLPELNQAWQPRTKKEEEAKKRGEFGAMQCVFCGEMTHPYDTPLLIQSALKGKRHYVLEGIQRELGLLVRNAKHIVFAGFRLPPDDYIERCMFQSAMASQKNRREPPYFTMVSYDRDYKTSGEWLEGKELDEYLCSPHVNDEKKGTIRSLVSLFDAAGKDRMRVSLQGLPGVVSSNRDGLSLKDAVKDLLYPRKCFPEGFPPIRPK